MDVEKLEMLLKTWLIIYTMAATNLILFHYLLKFQENKIAADSKLRKLHLKALYANTLDEVLTCWEECMRNIETPTTITQRNTFLKTRELLANKTTQYSEKY